MDHLIDPLPSMDRYVRQKRFAPLGQLGQDRIQQAQVLVCGCGALGSMIAERLVRAGVKKIRIVDRDWVEESNLPRQTLFSEIDAKECRPKAQAACDALLRIDSQALIEPIVEDITHRNIARLAQGCHLIMDGTDNFETRLLINDYALAENTPWVHGGVLGAGGQVMTIVPGATACFRCLVPDLPPREALPTCDTAGVLGSAVGIIACWQAAEAIKILSGNVDAICHELIVIDSWHTSVRLMSLEGLRASGDCLACGQRRFAFLAGEHESESTVLCGKNAVQIAACRGTTIELSQLASKLKSFTNVSANAFFIRFNVDGHTITIFRDGRAIVSDTTDPAIAKNLLARTVGG